MLYQIHFYALDWEETLEEEATALPSLRIYLCKDSLLFASDNSSLFEESFDIISNNVFFKIGFSLVSLTLNSSEIK